MGADIGIYILGDTFLRTFISVYDFDNKRVGLAPAIQIDKNTGMKAWLIAVIAVSGFLVVALIVFFVCKAKKNREKKISE